MSDESTYKVKSMGGDKGTSALKKYRALMYGDVSQSRFLLTEFLTFILCGIPGALGLFLRMKLYPYILGECGPKVVFGRNIVLRHPHKIKLGARVVIDDNAVVDAKGLGNEGIEIGDDVYIGRNTIVYCKGGNIKIHRAANLSSNCQVFSSNQLEIGEGTVIGAFTYLLSGGEYDYANSTPFCEQDGMCTKGPCVIGDDCWLGGHVTVLDGVTIGSRCVIAAGTVVNKDLAPHSVAAGVPVRVIKEL